MITIPAAYFKNVIEAIEDTYMMEGTFNQLSEEHGAHLHDLQKIRDLVDQIETFISDPNFPLERQKVTLQRISDRCTELAKAFEPYSAQIDFANVEHPSNHFDYLAKLNSGFEAFVYYLEDLRNSLDLDSTETEEDYRSSQPKSSKRPRLPFSEYFTSKAKELHLPELIKREFPGIKGKELKIVLEVLTKYNYFNGGARDRQAIYEAMVIFFEHDIASKQAVFDATYVPAEFHEIENKFTMLLK